MTGLTAVASVAGRAIPVSLLEERLGRIRRGRYARHLPPTGGTDSAWLARWVVQELVRQAVLEHEVTARLRGSRQRPRPQGVPTRAEIGRLFAMVTRGIAVSEQDVLAYYERNVDLYRRPERRVVRHWLVRDSRSTPPEGAGDELVLRRAEFAGPLEDAVFSARVGDVVGPVESELGWHVARVERIEPETHVPYDEVRESIEVELLAAARAAAFAGWLEARTKALAVIEPAYEHPAHPIHGEMRHRH